ncbi:MAG TPA: FAD-binding oxidoreductase [Rhizomicrobium sp.]|jgi:FAD/FMN-containing dehydrogenase|nr:FAD-binding oxidoreductase [Rhizomicrobium sp.]
MNETFERLKQVVGAKGFSENPAEIAPHLEEWRSKYRGHSPLLLKPANTAEVAALLAICNETRIPIVPQGGNTGLVGGQIPLHGEVLLSTQRLNRLRRLDESGMTLTVEAGVTLAEVQRTADDRQLLFPLRLASEGSCTIGGNIATNAGGTHVLRYGMTRALVLGLEVVLADGRVLNLLRSLVKDNAGYDLKQIFIGSEGTLGVIAAATLRLFPKPDLAVTAFAAVPSPAAALALLVRMQSATGGMLSAFELMPRIALDLVLAHIDGTRDPLAAPSPWYVLMEATGGTQSGLVETFDTALAGAITNDIATDAAMAANSAQAARLWKLRESVSEAQKREGASIKHDISVPVAAIPDFIAQAVPAVLAIVPGARPVSFGHLGDGNLHFNFNAPEGGDNAVFLAQWDAVQQAVYDMVNRFHGSISAEHGVGTMKAAILPRYKSSEELDAMRALKQAFDPRNILNPGKLVPSVLRL